MIQPIVEGAGEITAVPLLLRRLRDAAQAFSLDIGTPIKRHRSQLVQREGITRGLEIARRQRGCTSILLLFDGDEDCPSRLKETVEAWTIEAARDIPSVVVIAHREYEAWFLASIESLRGFRGVRSNAPAVPNPEEHRDAKGELERLMDRGTGYNAVADQAALSSRIDLAVAYRGSRSFRRLVRAFGLLLHAEGFPVDSWPPAAWSQ